MQGKSCTHSSISLTPRAEISLSILWPLVIWCLCFKGSSNIGTRCYLDVPLVPSTSVFPMDLLYWMLIRSFWEFLNSFLSLMLLSELSASPACFWLGLFWISLFVPLYFCYYLPNLNSPYFIDSNLSTTQWPDGPFRRNLSIPWTHFHTLLQEMDSDFVGLHWALCEPCLSTFQPHGPLSLVACIHIHVKFL